MGTWTCPPLGVALARLPRDTWTLIRRQVAASETAWTPKWNKWKLKWAVSTNSLVGLSSLLATWMLQALEMALARLPRDTWTHQHPTRRKSKEAKRGKRRKKKRRNPKVQCSTHI